MVDATTATIPSPSEDPDPSELSLKRVLISGAYDFRNVFLYPLLTGIMTGLGFAVGKRVGEIYFYGNSPKSS